MKDLKCWVIVLIVVMGLGSGTAQAVTIKSFQFSGTVTGFEGLGTIWQDNGVSQGDLITGVFSYDLDSSDGAPSLNGLGEYSQSIPQGVEVSVGNFTFSSSNYYVQVYTSPSYTAYDGIMLGFAEDVSNSGITVLGWGSSPILYLTGSPGILADDSLPSMIDLQDWNLTQNGGLYAQSGNENQSLKYTITSVAPVPEPATMLLFGMGILCIAGATRKKQ